MLLSKNRDHYKALFHRLTEEHQPATETEELLVLKLAQSHWLIQRALDYQSGSMQQDKFITVEKQFSLFMRYQSQQERVFNKALAELKWLQKERRDDEYGVFNAKIASQCYRQSMEASKAEILKIEEAEAKAEYVGRQSLKSQVNPRATNYLQRNWLRIAERRSNASATAPTSRRLTKSDNPFGFESQTTAEPPVV